MIHVYAILERKVDLADVVGLGGAPVEQLPVGELTAVVTRHDADRLPADETALVRHAEVVDTIAATGAPVLPGRFGVTYGDEKELRAAVGENATRLASLLERVAGCVELGVRALEPRRATPANPASQGGDYLRTRLAEQRRRERLEAEIHDPLARLSRDSTRRTNGSTGLDFSGAYLVPTEDVETFRRRFDDIAQSHEDLTLVCTGPWAPYSFADTGDTS